MRVVGAAVLVVAMTAIAVGQEATNGAKTLGELAAALQYDEVYARRAAVDALGRMGADAIPALAEAMRDDDWVIQMDATDSLAYLGTSAVPPLVKALQDQEHNGQKPHKKNEEESLGMTNRVSVIKSLISQL